MFSPLNKFQSYKVKCRISGLVPIKEMDVVKTPTPMSALMTLVQNQQSVKTKLFPPPLYK